MKYIIIVPDGAADYPIEELGGRTPLQFAKIPNMDFLASNGTAGYVRNIPKGFSPGSDVANLSILGYDPRIYYTGRAPLEAVSMGLSLSREDVAFRCNLVTLNLSDKKHIVMEDYSAGHISSEEAKILIDEINSRLGSDGIRFYPGISYRHIMLWKNGSEEIECIPPHDITGKEISRYMPIGRNATFIKELILKSIDILKDHPVNQKRISEGKRPANSVWLWGQGKTPSLPAFYDKYKLKGALISAVDLTKGIGILAGLHIINVPGATGWIDTNYSGKAEYALNILERVDFVYLHIEAPDEAGHQGDYKLKIKSLEDIDRIVIGKILEEAPKRFNEFKILLLPDHPTPVKLKTHTPEPVPFVVYNNRKAEKKNRKFSEEIINSPDIKIEDGYRLMDFFITGHV
ncbi:MAG TPA: cofactor-independent phosphoglycerate mutase [Thermodesulfovibrio thiophilus]|uniref:cofactor-independent phosphoglycerate mutase n=1 Tax=Thermodesulfovibrio thiophilus TaxID=340095 RepID=UPI0017D2189C|nr:cofactor-independent phosphoglycerate mutase [Thermodesulfovibrio thiophilus]HHW20653.1 cofactor-independent phosphoglycerate mutase [Thermodesulfovibrio thiophilus]HOA82727.1 cofactor-independent phosphoglycerate mutase [Thermodesulfovibrio thiophilus]HQA03583.1 cofactor-independent phosphoglycerate mutase [Thermodesulfovibrio thiophilus]